MAIYLQLALDRLSHDQCFSIVDKAYDHIDWIEIGTGVIKEYGIAIIHAMKNRYPDKLLVADMKTCDAGMHETYQALEAGADITSVMAFSAERTIANALEAARQLNKRVMVDLLGVTQQEKINHLQSLGVDLVSVHQAKDMQELDPISNPSFCPLDTTAFQTAVAGGITENNLPQIMKQFRPDVVIAGSAITNATDPSQAAFKLKGLMSSE